MKKAIKAMLAALIGILAIVFLGRKEKVEPVKTEREKELEQRVDDLKERQRRRKAKIGGTLILLLFLSWPATATDWETLYRETEADLDEALAIVAEYQDIIEEKNKEIERLSKPAWGLGGGLEVAESPRWSLGVSKKQGWKSWTLGVSGPDFGIFGFYTFWLQIPF